MAQVPEYGLQQEMPQGSVAPVQLHVPNDNALMNYAEQIGRPNKELEAVARQAQEKMDNARVTEAETRLYKFMIDRRDGENGFRKLKMQQAMEPDSEGNSLPDREDNAMRSYADEVASDMGLNERQRALFRQRSHSYFRQQYGTASQHMFQEAAVYEKAQQTSKRNTAIDDCQKAWDMPDILAANIARAQDASLALMDGADEGMKAEAIRKATDDGASAAIAGALEEAAHNNDAVYRAQDILGMYVHAMSAESVAKARTNIDRVSDALAVNRGGSSINDALRTVIGPLSVATRGVTNPSASYIFHHVVHQLEASGGHAKVTVDKNGVRHAQVLIGTYKDGSRPANRAEWSFGGSQIQLRNAEAMAKKLGIKWDPDLIAGDRAGTDEGKAYNLKLGEAFFDEMFKAAKGDTALALAYYHAGQPVVDRAIKNGEKYGMTWLEYMRQAHDADVAAGRDGKNGNPRPRFEHTLEYVAKGMKLLDNNREASLDIKDADGKRISQFNVKAVAAAQRSYSRRDIEAYIKRMAAVSTDPMYARAERDLNFKEKLITETLKQQKYDQDALLNDQTNALAEATDLIVAGQEVPDSLRSKLTYAQNAELDKFVGKVTRGDDSGDLRYAVYLENSGNPEFLQMSEAQMKLAVLQCPKSEREKLRRQWYVANDQRNKQANLTANAEMGILFDAFRPEYGAVRTVANTLFPEKLKKSLGKDGVNMATAVIANAIWPEMQALGKKPTQADIERAVKNALNRTYKISRFFGYWNTEKGLFDLDYDDLPKEVRTILTTFTKRRLGEKYKDEPSEDQVMATFWDLMISPYPGVTFRGLTLDNDLWRAAQELEQDPVDQMRLYISSLIGGESAESVRKASAKKAKQPLEFK